MNSKTLIKFLKRLVKDATQKVFLILDNLRVHHSKPVKEWVEAHTDEIEFFFLPSYSPELNQNEYLNCDLKAGVHSGSSCQNSRAIEKEDDFPFKDAPEKAKKSGEILPPS
ncbi:MAG: transposase [Desulfobacterales bacterium]|nr:transposase [Desulfobacterales bacterium]